MTTPGLLLAPTNYLFCETALLARSFCLTPVLVQYTAPQAESLGRRLATHIQHFIGDLEITGVWGGVEEHQ